MAIKITGIKKARRALNKVKHQMPEASEQFVFAALTGIEQHTVPYVPVDTSNLVNSRHVTSSTEGTRVTGTLSYGGTVRRDKHIGARVAYARYVHDGPQRNWQKPGASNKFLAKGVQDFIRDDLDDLIKAFSP